MKYSAAAASASVLAPFERSDFTCSQSFLECSMTDAGEIFRLLGSMSSHLRRPSNSGLRSLASQDLGLYGSGGLEGTSPASFLRGSVASSGRFGGSTSPLG